jgi:hypothetical protein
MNENRRLLALGPHRLMARSPCALPSQVVSPPWASTRAARWAAVLHHFIENNAQLRLDLQIPERLASHVRPGMAVHVEQDGRSATGRLLSLASTIDPATRALAAKASLPTDTGLIPGKSVMVTLAATDLAAKDIAAGKGSSVSVPSEAVTHIGDHDVVFRRELHGFRAVTVTVAGQIGTSTVLSGGLEPGQKVAVSSIAELKSLSQGAEPMLRKLIEAALAWRMAVLGLAVLLGIGGAWSFVNLPIDAFPDISSTQVKVILKAPGMTPEEVESRVIAPIEQEMLGIPHQTILRSVAKYAIADVTINFDDSTDVYWARNQVGERLIGCHGQSAVHGDGRHGAHLDAAVGHVHVHAGRAAEPCREAPCARLGGAPALRTVPGWPMSTRWAAWSKPTRWRPTCRLWPLRA